MRARILCVVVLLLAAACSKKKTGQVVNSVTVDNGRCMRVSSCMANGLNAPTECEAQVPLPEVIECPAGMGEGGASQLDGLQKQLESAGSATASATALPANE